MSDSMLANFDAFEGTGSGTVTLNRPSRKLVITNDSASETLTFKFNESESAGSLLPTESISLYFTTRQVILVGACDYRIWSFG